MPSKERVAGVFSKGKKWAAFVSYKGVKTHLGVFETYKEACQARLDAQLTLPKEEKTCPVCQRIFNAKTTKQKFCNPSCKGRWKYVTDSVTTESQYENISGNWSRYLSRLLYSSRRKRDGLKRDDLLALLHKQGGKCAISGLPLTCLLTNGTKYWSNASVDRVNAGQSYTTDNIQLVCRAVNSWRSDIPLDKFIEICRAVANNNPERLEVRDGRA